MKRIILILLVFSCVAFKGYAQKPVFNHVSILVSNPQVSEEFYIKWFHLDPIPSPFPGGHILWLSLGNGVQLHLIQGSKNNMVVSKDNHIAFSVPSLDDFIALLKKENMPFDNGGGKIGINAVRPDGVKQVYFRDPDGYKIEVNDAH